MLITGKAFHHPFRYCILGCCFKYSSASSSLSYATLIFQLLPFLVQWQGFGCSVGNGCLSWKLRFFMVGFMLFHILRYLIPVQPNQRHVLTFQSAQLRTTHQRTVFVIPLGTFVPIHVYPRSFLVRFRASCSKPLHQSPNGLTVGECRRLSVPSVALDRAKL